jgi:hypothetical protein
LGESSTLVGGGKEGVLYALDTTNALKASQVGKPKMSSAAAPCDPERDPVTEASGPGYTSIQASPLWQRSFRTELLSLVDQTALSLGFHHIHGSPVRWKVHERTLLYVSPERDVLRAFEFDEKGFSFVDGSVPGQPPRDTFHSKCPNSAKKGMPGGFLTISANGDDPASGIVWALMPRRNKDAFVDIVPGVLRAYEAYPSSAPELKEVWNSDNDTTCEQRDPAGNDQVGLFAKFVPPTVVDGKVYVATFSGYIAVYGLRTSAP